MRNEINKINEENIRAEYAALNSYGNQVVSFRFTLVGFYLAFIGLIMTGSPSVGKAFLILWLSIVLWILELRNRALLSNLSERGMQIERDYWGYSGSKAYDAFISHQNKVEPLNDPEAGEPPGLDYTKILFWRLRLPVSHTLALDLMYLGVILYTIIQLFIL
jgi:hypothetical protein